MITRYNEGSKAKSLDCLKFKLIIIYIITIYTIKLVLNNKKLSGN